MRAKVLVTLKPEVLDPQGEAVRRGLVQLGLVGIREVRIGKVIELDLVDSPDVEATRKLLQRAAEELFANPVIEDWRVELDAVTPTPQG
ncbi:MAG: phosphoribosylformylglycinamidine synthase subunit PurS [Deltaproteobacteria bacterium]|nr:phosphoribosylformylglycinamidine synthase subunit PurS [Deltaproteobacteria bacterium]